MRLPIISFAVFAVCFGLFGCTNARSWSSDNKVSLMKPSLSKTQNESTNVLLLVTTSSKILTSQYSTKHVNISEYEIEDYKENFNNYGYVKDFTSTCRDNIYILKKMLEVIRYNKTNNKFERTNQIKDLFDNAISITSDYMGKIYWIDYVKGEFSIKVTNESFKKSEYIIHPTRDHMFELQAHPKRNKLFFLSDDSIWYTSKSLNSTPNKLFSSDVKFPNIFVFGLTIDYVTDKLCWIHFSDSGYHLYCVVIGTFDRQLNPNKIVKIEEMSRYTRNFVAFNNTFYWTEINTRKLYFKNGNETTVEIADLPENELLLSIVPSICPSAQEEGAKINDVPPSSTEINIPKQKQCECPGRTETPIKSANFFFATLQKFSLMKQFTNELTISNIEIESNSQSNFKSYDSIGEITNNCAKNIIYMLKYNASNVSKKTFDVIHYDENNKFKKIRQVENMFDNAISITSDYKTGKIYWAVNDDEKYSIKVTDELFSEWNYIIYPNNKYPIEKIQVYPKGSEIFYFEGNKIWYTNNSLNSAPKLLLNSSEVIIDFAIDYATDNLCWTVRRSFVRDSSKRLITRRFDEFFFYCVNIDTSLRPIVQPQPKFYQLGYFFRNLGAFNNTLYWTGTMYYDVQLLHANDGYETTVKLAKMKNDPIQSFVSLNCPSTVGAASIA